MLQIVGLVVPIFAVIVFGRLSISRKILDPDGLAALNGFAYWLALPALLFGSIAESHAPQVMGIAGIYLACCILVFAFAMFVGYLLFGGSLAKSAVFGLNATYGNVIFLGTPLVAAFFGPQGVTQILAIIAFHSGVLLPLAAVLMELGSGRQGGVRAVIHRTVHGLVGNPIIVSIFLGFAWRATGIAVPGPIHNLLAVLGPSAAPLALFCLGASLPAIATEPAIIREATVATLLKLTVLPFCVGWVAWFMGLSGLPWRVAVVTAAMPTGANAFLLARRATSFAESSACTVVVATAVSVISITGLLTWLM
jgi:malonate transporter